MGISLKPQHLNRYRQIAWLSMKYGRSDLVKSTGLEETLEAEQKVTSKESPKAEEAVTNLENPTEDSSTRFFPQSGQPGLRSFPGRSDDFLSPTVGIAN